MIDTDALRAELEQRPGEELPELLAELRGEWFVVTARSAYHFDLDKQTVTRLPGTGASPTMNDGVQKIRSIESCKVGARGYWTMRPGPYDAEFSWQISSEIIHIVRLLDENPDAQEPNAVNLHRHEPRSTDYSLPEGHRPDPDSAVESEKA